MNTSLVLRWGKQKRYLQINWKERTRNSHVTPNKILRCLFHHPEYCTTLGHRSCRSIECAMYFKTKKKRDAALTFIKMESSHKIAETIRESNKSKQVIFFWYLSYNGFSILFNSIRFNSLITCFFSWIKQPTMDNSFVIRVQNLVVSKLNNYYYPTTLKIE